MGISVVRLLFITMSFCSFLMGCKNPLSGENSTVDSGFHPGVVLSLENSVVSISNSSVMSGNNVTLSVQLKDQNGNAFTDPKVVNFSLSGGASTGSIGTVTSLGNGVYAATFTGNIAGTHLILNASADGDAITSAQPIVLVTPGIPTAISINSGNSQSGYTSEALSNSLVVLVKDSNGNNVPSATVNWAVVSGSGTLTSASSVTDSNGLASNALTFGLTTGVTNVTATIQGTPYSVSFSATANLRALTVLNVNPSTTFLEGGKTLTITGSGFVSGLSVSIGGAACTSVAVQSATQLTCVNPAHTVGVVNIQLDRYDAATATLTNGFTYSSTLFTTANLVSGILSTKGSSNGVGSAARFYHPTDLVESNGILYVSDTKNNLIRQINLATGLVSDLAGVRGVKGTTDGLGNVAKFNGPTGMAISGNYLYVSDTDNCSIRRIDLTTTQVTTWAGTSGSCLDSANGSVGNNIKFVHPWGLASDGTYLYVVDSQDAYLSLAANLIRKIDFATVTVTTIAGDGSCGGANGNGTAAQFCAPVGIAISGTNLFIGDMYYYKVRKIDMSVSPAAVTLFAGMNNATGSANGIGNVARFSRMGDIVSDGTYLYIADSGNNTIRKAEISTRNVTTVVGTAGTSGFLDGIGTAAKLYRPGGMALVGTKLYFTDMGNDAIRTYDTVTGAVSAYAGYGGF